MALAIFAASLLPGLVYLYGLYRYDRYEPEPRGWVALIFFLGMGAANIAVAAENGLEMLAPVLRASAAYGPDLSLRVDMLFLRQLALIAPIEEGLKLAAVLVAFANRRVFNEPLDGLVYAAAAALGFASLENAAYAFASDANILVARSLLTLPMHLVASVIWGLGLAYWRFSRPNRSGLLIFFVTLALGVALHASYNVLVRSGATIPAGALIVIAGLALLVPIRSARRRSPFRTSILPPSERQSLGVCPKCGAAGTISTPCKRCKTAFVSLDAPELTPPPLHPRWTFLAVAVLGLSAAAIGSIGTSLGATVSMLSAGFTVTVGAMIIGRLSPGVTIAEPAIAGMFASIVFLLVLGGRFESALVLSPIGLILAVIGAWLGEKWQSRALEKSRTADNTKS